uniref:Uncharacterized protein n=1 Tax=Leptospirillum ferrodiazotrophum TaxID=412449 RepID=C6HWY1_9BACT|nr:MAG: hypothetical protein UBAL3_82700053 [Leptospirillum ferrodiazotrophum]
MSSGAVSRADFREIGSAAPIGHSQNFLPPGSRSPPDSSWALKRKIEGFLRVLAFPSMEIPFCREGKPFHRKKENLEEAGFLFREKTAPSSRGGRFFDPSCI